MNELAEAAGAVGQSLISGPTLLGFRSQVCHNRALPNRPLCHFSVRVHIASFLGCCKARPQKHAGPAVRKMYMSLMIVTIKGGGSQKGVGPRLLPSVTARWELSTLR